MKVSFRMFEWRSLRTRITAGVLLLSLSMLWGTVLSLSHTLREDMEAAISAQQFSTVSLIAGELDRSIRERLSVVESISGKLSAEMMRNPDRVQAYLEQRDIPETTFNWGILVVDSEGIAIASTPEKLQRRGIDLSSYPVVKQVLLNGKTHIADPLFSQHSKQPVVTMLVPILAADRQVLGIVIGVINLAESNFLDEISTSKYGRTGSFFVTAPETRTYVASSGKLRQMKVGPPPGINPVYDRYINGYEGSGVALSSRGVIELSSSKRIPTTGWLMQSVLPTDEAFEPIRLMQQHLLIISVILSVLATLLAWWWLRRQFSPLIEVSGLLNGMTSGTLPRQALPVRKMDEIGTLTAAFNQLQEVIVSEEAKAAEHAANTRLRRIVSALPGVVFQYRLLPDGHGQFPFVSDAITDIYGVTPEELEKSGDPIRKLLYPDDAQAFFTSLYASARDRSPWRVEYRITTTDGHLKWLLVDAIPEAESDDTVIWFGFIADITRTKAMEAELRLALEEHQRKDTEIERYRDHLEQLVSERTADLEQARAEAVRLARIKSDFLANMSHEIRTPLNGVLGMAHIGVRTTEQNTRANEAFRKIVSSGTLLLGIINDILDLSKMEAGMLKIEATEIELAPILAETIELMQERASNKGVSLDLKTANLPASIRSDPLRLRQILLNLLSNAVKFTEAGKVDLEVGLDEGELQIRVTDTGIGITDSQIGKIFHPFEQGDNSTTRRFGGTGLGLAITERIVKLMGGNISVHSVPGQGSVFSVRLPYHPGRANDLSAAPISSIQPTDPARPLAGLKILVAEDNEINQEIMRDNLTEDGASVTLVDNGQLAVDAIRNSPPGSFDCILMDVQMPVLSGLDAARQIKAITPALPIIGQTAHALTQDREDCLAAGMDDYISKPIDPQKLNTLIRKHLPGQH
ncbi:ATP-binding protein [Quatrionicoccus australiensis]|uniref:ATP-binding protein n=1 Tax=Quatrionicoccus australiensis TaxID=138118 RepID=UPI001CFBB5BF|nr:ATP-binding protein [Quatrionicoccus australiensis]MCB4361950.1 response regulator [Quatrionicoccus australiensis]